ncbi:MAG: cation efflux protein, CzcI family [Burkholderiaceae bacterium]
MKRLLLILLLAILPLQATWAAVATYCQHEKESTSRHFGHHQHEHEHQHAQAEEQQKDSSIKFHTDCLTCQAAAAAMIIPAVDAVPVETASAVQVSSDPLLTSFPSSRPEKPKWVFAA